MQLNCLIQPICQSLGSFFTVDMLLNLFTKLIFYLTLLPTLETSAVVETCSLFLTLMRQQVYYITLRYNLLPGGTAAAAPLLSGLATLPSVAAVP